mmetsp:Transcript_5503/g.14522  ORF Transcript_5503/g.14522 Transcript_5503/m.14522 type:complete len:395 (-) Transcript_5503:899-2083(-)
MALVRDDLGCQILGRAAERPCAVWHHLGKSEVDDLYVAERVEEQVLRLEVAVDDLLVVHVRKGGLHASRVEARLRLLEAVLLAQHREEFAPERELEQHVDLVLILISGHQLEQEGMVAHLEERLLIHDVLDLLEGDDLPLAHALECVRLLVVSHELHTPKSTDAEDGALLERRHRNLGAARFQYLLLAARGLARKEVFAAKQLLERRAVELHARRRRRRYDARKARLVLEQSHLAKKVRGPKFLLDHSLLARRVVAADDADGASLDDIEGVSLRALLDHLCPLPKALLDQVVNERRLLRVRELMKDLHRAENLLVEVELDDLTQLAEELGEVQPREFEHRHLAHSHYRRLPLLPGCVKRRLPKEFELAHAAELLAERLAVRGLIRDDLARLDEV